MTGAAFETAYYTSSKYWFGQKVYAVGKRMQNLQYAKKSHMYTESQEIPCMCPTNLPHLLFQTM